MFADNLYTQTTFVGSFVLPVGCYRRCTDGGSSLMVYDSVHQSFGGISCFYLQVATPKTKAVCPEDGAAICHVSMNTASYTTRLDSSAAPDSPLETDYDTTTSTPKPSTDIAADKARYQSHLLQSLTAVNRLCL
jgi:hypothetical protein